MADAGSGDEGSRPGGDRALYQVPLAGLSPWLAKEFPGAFEGDLGEVAFVPAPEGVFMIGSTGRLSGDSRAEGFPERAAVKRASGTASRRAGTPAGRIARMLRSTDGTGQARRGKGGHTARGPESGIPVAASRF